MAKSVGKKTAQTKAKGTVSKSAVKKAGQAKIAKAAPKASAAKSAASKTTAPKNTAKKAAAKKPSPGQSSYKLKVGDRAPAFSVPGTSGETVSLASFAGRKLVLYFYPKDNTPGCTLEGQDFKRLYSQFQAAGCDVVGVSRDSLKSHDNFRSKCGFPFELLSDEDGALCKAFDVIQMKSLYGRKFEGIERSTFVIDPSGIVRAEWRKVKVADHAQKVLKFVKGI